MPHRHPRRPRRLAGQADAAVHPWARGRRHVERVGAGVTSASGRRPRGDAWLGYACGHCRYCVSGLGDAVREPAQLGLLGERCVRRVRRRRRRTRDAGPRRDLPRGRRPADLRRRDHVQGHQGRARGAGRDGRRLRRRRSRSPGRAVRPYRRRVRRRRGRRRGASSPWPRELGADHVVNARTTDPVRAIQDLGGADVAVALAASPESFEQAYRSLRRGGRLVCVGLPADGTMTLPIFDTVLNGTSVIGSIVGHPQRPGRRLRAARCRTYPGDRRSIASSTRSTSPSTTSSPATSRRGCVFHI